MRVEQNPSSQVAAFRGPVRERRPKCRLLGKKAGALSLLMLLVTLPAGLAGALSLSTIDVRTGIPWLGVSGQGQVVAPSPLMYEWGVSVPIELSSSFALLPELDLFGTQYQLVGSGPRAIPTEIEYKSSVFLLGAMISPALRYTLHINKVLAWGASVSPSVLLRIPTLSWGLTSQQIGTITSYFYAKARFFYPSAGTFFLWQLLPNIGIELRLRTFLPVFHLWDGEGLPFYDQLIIEGSIGFRFALGG